MASRDGCQLVASFLARQGVVALAGLLFLAYTAVRVRYGLERRDLRTFAADCTKQAGQQALGGTLMLLMGLRLAEDGLDALAWYGAEYPFEIVLTTYATGVCRRRVEQLARWLSVDPAGPRWGWAAPMALFGQYGAAPGDWSWRWYGLQLAQAVLLIGLPARLFSLGLIWVSLMLPEAVSPVGAVARLWYGSGLSCAQQAALILYVAPLVGDALQFVIIDGMQRFAGARGRDADGGDGAAPSAAGFAGMLEELEGGRGCGHAAGLLSATTPPSSNDGSSGAPQLT